MVDRAGGARFGALGALHGLDVFIALLSKGCCARSRQRCAINPKNLSVGLAFSDGNHRKTSWDTPVAHRCTDSYVECTGADPETGVFPMMKRRFHAFSEDFPSENLGGPGSALVHST